MTSPEAFGKMMSVVKPRMADADEATWAPPLASPAQPPSLEDRVAFAKRVGLDPNQIGFSDYTKSGYYDVDDVLRPIYEEASEALGRKFKYPGDD